MSPLGYGVGSVPRNASASISRITHRKTHTRKKKKKKDLTYSLCTIILKIAFMVKVRHFYIYSQHKCDLAITKDCIGELTIVYAIMIHVLWKE